MLPRTVTHQSATVAAREITAPPNPLAWLLDFAQRQSFTAGEFLDLGLQAVLFCAGDLTDQRVSVGRATVGRAKVSNAAGTIRKGDPLILGEPLTPQELQRSHAVVSDLVGQLRRARQTGEVVEWENTTPASFRLAFAGDGSFAAKEYRDEAFTMFIARATDLLYEGWPTIRGCKRSECGRLFDPAKRQVFCSKECARLFHWSEYMAKHPNRKRDYHAEYRSRVTGKTHGKVRIARRPRKATKGAK